jgi:hypothetical protein
VKSWSGGNSGGENKYDEPLAGLTWSR